MKGPGSDHDKRPESQDFLGPPRKPEKNPVSSDTCRGPTGRAPGRAGEATSPEMRILVMNTLIGGVGYNSTPYPYEASSETSRVEG